MTDLETKQKILETARVLFADHGYEGTSIREIAKAAEVNVASVNYYFNSKENLFLEILRAGYVECANEIQCFLDKNQGNVEETMVDIFRYFLDNSHNLKSHFKLMMSAQHSHHLMTEGSEDRMYGPPGGMVIAGILKKLAPDANDRDIHWALKTLFSHVSHLSLIHTCCMKTNQDIPFSSQEDLELSVRRIVKMVISELKNPQHSF